MRGNILFKILDRYLGVFIIFYLGILSKIFIKSGKEVKSILLVKLSALGDTILLFPVVKALKKRYGDARIIVVCTEINRAIWEKMSYVDKIYCVDIKKLFDPYYVFRFFLNLRKHNFDLAIDFDQWLRISAILTMISKANERIGFNTPGQYKHFGFTQTIRHVKRAHELDCFIRLAGLSGIEVRDKSVNFPVSEKDEEKIKKMLTGYGAEYGGEKYIVVHPGCGSHGWQREWPPERYSEICNILIEKYSYHVILTGGNSETEVVNSVVKEIKSHVINLQGKLDISTLATLLKGADLFISGNTGIMHLAAAVGTKCISIHGPTDANKWGPVGMNNIIIKSPVSCSPCLYLGHEYGCSTRKCMEAVCVDEVKLAVESIVNE